MFGKIKFPVWGCGRKAETRTFYFPPEALSADVGHLLFRVMDLSETRHGAGIIIEVAMLISACVRFVASYTLSQKPYILVWVLK